MQIRTVINRVKNIIKKLGTRTTIPYVVSLLFLTKFLGYIKLRVIAQLFGASHELDIFWASFVVPDIIFNILVAGSINAAVIPVFSKVLNKTNEEKLAKLFRDVNILLAILALCLGMLVFVFSGEVATTLLGGEGLRRFLGVSQELQQSDILLLTRLIRITTISPIILGLSSMTIAYLRVHKKFIVANLPPLLYNIAFILGTYILALYLKLGVLGLAWSAIIASLFHFIVQLPTLWRLLKKYLYNGEYQHNDEQLNKNHELSKSKRITFVGYIQHIWLNVTPIVRLATPRVFGILGEQVNSVFNTMLSFTITPGALSAYKYAFSLHLLPVHILGGALSQVMLTKLSEYYATNNNKRFSKTFNQSLQLTIFSILPFVATFLVLRLPIVRLTYGVGAFDWWDTRFTSWSLALLSFAMLAQAVVSITIRAYYAVQETRIPLIVTLLTIVVNLVATYYAINFFSHYNDWRPLVSELFRHFTGDQSITGITKFGGGLLSWFTTRSKFDYAVGGISAGFTISYLFEMTLGLVLLNRRIKVVSWKETIKPFILKLFITIITILMMYVMYQNMDVLCDTTRTVGVIIVFVVTSVIGWLLYILLSILFNVPEFHYWFNRAKVLLASSNE